MNLDELVGAALGFSRAVRDQMAAGRELRAIYQAASADGLVKDDLRRVHRALFQDDGLPSGERIRAACYGVIGGHISPETAEKHLMAYEAAHSRYREARARKRLLRKNELVAKIAGKHGPGPLTIEAMAKTARSVLEGRHGEGEVLTS